MANKKASAIVIGANGGIGSAVLSRLQKDQNLDTVFAISREVGLNNEKTSWFSSDYSEPSINMITSKLSQRDLSIRYIIIATGILHDDAQGIYPEKRLSSLNKRSLDQVFSANTFNPMLWLKGLTPLLKKGQATNIVVLSARVGSISDNKLGGWYSYRASKTALNMMLKSLTIEFRLRFPLVKITAFHPGTTDTQLSKPFQDNIPKDKIFEPDFVAEQLHQLLKSSKPDGELSFQDWQHKSIEW